MADKYEHRLITEVAGDGSLRAEEIVIVPWYVAAWVKIAVKIRYCMVMVSRGLLWGAEKMLDFTAWFTKKTIPEELRITIEENY